jgi:hypothetical protein
MRVFEKEWLRRILRGKKEKVTKEAGENCMKTRTTNCTVQKILR